ncbi:membrane protease YdiL (CAAX protease family) [Undibacterium sp. GrIS 1.2]|uniref:CPBP family intramembrane glutamic endopeptidase n=1 Tax=Undibacterium sp. GrIS 1.2 TaxID=3143933 RepID=UPI003393CD7C
MKTFLSDITVNFLYSTFIGLLVIILLVLSGVIDDDVEGYTLIAFSLTVIWRYCHSLERSAASIDLIPFRGKISSYQIFLSVMISIWVFMTLMLSVHFFHGKIFISEKLELTNLNSIILIITTAAMEEIIFRGYIFGFLRTFLGKITAIFLTSVIFSIAHYPYSLNLLSFVDYFSFGICLSLLSIRYNSLIPGAIYHALSNYGIGLSRLNIGGKFNHLGMFHFENGSPNNSYMISSIVVSILISGYFFKMKEITKSN